MSSARRGKTKPKKKKVSLALKRVRKAMPPPARVFKHKRLYSRRRKKKELERVLSEDLPGRKA